MRPLFLDRTARTRRRITVGAVLLLPLLIAVAASIWVAMRVLT